ncbi:MAG TPA: GNAT family N-acetyltransferase [Gaiellaceae bacterium]
MGELHGIGDLIRRVYAAAPGFNAWTFARFDIWCQWREADGAYAARAFGDEAAALVGEAPDDGVLILHPDALELVPDLLAWVEEHCRAPVLVEVNESNEALSAAVAAAGFELLDGHYVPRRKRLAPNPRPRIELVPITADIERYLDASAAVFGRRFSADAYLHLHAARSYHPELGLMVMRDGIVAAFANAWLDRDLGVAEFEPVGTRAGYQGHGLASALLLEIENRLLALGIGTAIVHSWSDAEGANRLYDKLGYRRVDRQRNWRK